MSMDYYKILGVSKNASEDDIKKAYRKLAHQHHPDKNGGDDKKFKEINEAYQVLSNKEKRAQYDRFGRVFGNASGGGPFGGNPFGEGFGFNFDASNFEDLGNLSDIFDAFFEGLGVKRRKTYQRGSDLELAQEISLEDAFSGSSKKIDVRTFVACKECLGLGHDPKSGFQNCHTCDGKGEIKEARSTIFGSFSQIKTCSKCMGNGQIPNKICKTCSGTGRVSGNNSVAVDIVPGVQDGQLIKIARAGEKGERGAEAGDLYIRIKIKPHPVFKRSGDDLIVKKELNLVDVLLGKKIEIPKISGGTITVEIPPKFNLKEKLIIGSEGMPRLGGYGRGNLLIDLEIKTPKKISAKAKKLLEELEKEL